MRARHLMLLAAGLWLPMAAGAGAAEVRVTLRFDPETQIGSDPEGHVLLYTPRPIQPGSSRSHFDTSAFPDLLMEPGISPDLEVGGVDLTAPAMRDMGWPRGSFEARIDYSDAAGVGFNDAELGAERRAALEFAVRRWQGILGSAVTLHIEARFRTFDCDEEGGTLAAAGPNFVFMDFANGEVGTWYPGALAEALSGQNLSLEDVSDPNAADMTLSFNSLIDEGCLGEGSRFYYPTDDRAPPGEISFATVAMHELGHGLGFTGFSDLESGELFRGAPDIFTTFTFDTRFGKSWDELNERQRRKSAKRPGKVSFTGPETTAGAEELLAGSEIVEVESPRNLAGAYAVGRAFFGPPLDEAGVSGQLALVRDGSDNPTFGCETLTNPEEIAGRIALVDRGECLFTIKVKNAQVAGAIGVIVIHNEPGPPPGLGGSDETITIPSVRVARRDGRRLKKRLRK